MKSKHRKRFSDLSVGNIVYSRKKKSIIQKIKVLQLWLDKNGYSNDPEAITRISEVRKLKKEKLEIERIIDRLENNSSNEIASIICHDEFQVNKRFVGSEFSPQQKKVSRNVLNAISYAEGKAEKRKYDNLSEPFLYNSALDCYDNVCNGTNGKIELYVRKGKHVFQPHFCADCKNIENPIWRYRSSNYGEIHLCNICKTLAFERTFGHADAMPLKIDHAHTHKGKW